MTVFHEYSSKIIYSVPNPLKLANDLWSAKLVSSNARDIAHGICDYEKAFHVVDDFEKQLTYEEKKMNKLIKFCDVLIDQDSPSLTSFAEKMKSKLNQTLACN